MMGKKGPVMTTKIHAVFERGVFRPTDPIVLADGAVVELIVSTGIDPKSPLGLTAIMAEIAALPVEGVDDRFSGADHDALLYPKRGQY